MDPAEAILIELRTDAFIIKVGSHADKRMFERNVRRADISNLGYNGKIFHQGRDRYLVKGKDLDGDSLSAVIQFDGDVVIVTVME